METLKEAKSPIEQGCFFASTDLQDAYLHIPIVDDGSRNLLHFLFENQLFRINSLMFGLNVAPRTFTKLLRPVMAMLRSLGVLLLIYLHDLLLIAMSKEEGKEAVDKAIAFLINLGFKINFAKSMLDPIQLIEWLGHLIDLLKMTIPLPQNKLENTRSTSRKFLNRAQRGETVTLKELASFVGKLNSCSEAINHARLHSNAIRQDHQKAQMADGRQIRNFICPVAPRRSSRRGSVI